MAKPKVFDLNKWEKVKTEPELDGYQGLVIIPPRLENGTQLPSIYYRRGEVKSPEIEDVSTIEWFKDVRISKLGHGVEYAKRVDWWFDNALKDEEYRQIINDTFNRNGFDVKISWEKAKNDLKRYTPSDRKTYIHRFVWNWMIRGMKNYLSYKERKGSYSK